jgi:formylglycine-generating enzyme
MMELGAVAPMRMQGSALKDTLDAGMERIPGGTFRMGSDRHYADEAPVHRVTVDAF